ncbi:MAG: sporulation protein YunB [Oscillospiraceae bacterium]|nr:sporulation protein YunB [Oscillospiraceae bacterium]
MLNKKIKKRRKYKKYIFLIIIFAVIITIIFEIYIKPLQIKIMENRAKVIVEARVSKIASEVIDSSEYDYNNLLVKSTSERGVVTSLSVNSQAVNKLQNEFSDVFQNKIDDLISQHFSLPIGDLTNITMLAGKGPRINFNYDMTGSVNVELESSFTSTGINQTLHRLNMKVNAEIVFISQSYMENITISNDFAVSETVIVGNTPDYLYPKY